MHIIIILCYVSVCGVRTFFHDAPSEACNPAHHSAVPSVHHHSSASAWQRQPSTTLYAPLCTNALGQQLIKVQIILSVQKWCIIQTSKSCHFLHCENLCGKSSANTLCASTDLPRRLRRRRPGSLSLKGCCWSTQSSRAAGQTPPSESCCQPECSKGYYSPWFRLTFFPHP